VSIIAEAWRRYAHAMFAGPRAMRIALWAALAWTIAAVAPYAVIGESWGAIWYYMAFPSSVIGKDMWEYNGVLMYVAVATVSNLALLVLLIRSLSLFAGAPANPEPSPEPAPEASARS
jgi:hypothetical protein